VVRAAGFGIDHEIFDADPVAAISAAVAGLSTQAVVDRLNELGLAAVPVRRVSEVIRDPRLLEAEFLHVRPSDDGQYICVPGKYATFSRTGRYGLLPLSGIGEDSTAVLRSAGLDDITITQLITDHVVAQGGPAIHILSAAYR
jgi:crotonobetainyl-CoA:carnitine CoA-transferase CaiB-like acyl-CoA transferase